MERNDHLEWPAWKLTERAALLKGNYDAIDYGEARAGQVKAELGAIALELLCRQLENQDQDPGAAIALLDIDYFGFHHEAKGLSLGRAAIALNG